MKVLLSKIIRIGDEQVALHSLDGRTWSARKEDLQRWEERRRAELSRVKSGWRSYHQRKRDGGGG